MGDVSAPLTALGVIATVLALVFAVASFFHSRRKQALKTQLLEAQKKHEAQLPGYTPVYIPPDPASPPPPAPVMPAAMPHHATPAGTVQAPPYATPPPAVPYAPPPPVAPYAPPAPAPAAPPPPPGPPLFKQLVSRQAAETPQEERRDMMWE